MTVRGKIKNGKVVLDTPKAFAEGTDVEVRPVRRVRKPAKSAKVKAKKKTPPRSLADRLRPFIGALKDLPPDMSVNLDHYLYGHPKQE